VWLVASDLYAQRQAENWYFGDYAGLSFKSGTPIAQVDGAMITREGCITVSDTSGNLLFYSDGTSVWNKKHTRMPSGANLRGDASSTQSCIVVPWPGMEARYFLFTVDALEDTYIFGLNYSIVDMRLAGGNGDVWIPNQVLQPGTSEKVTAIRHANGEDAWVVTHSIGSNEFLVYSVTRNGVNTVPSRHRVGVAVTSGDIGYLRSSVQGTRLAMATTSPGRLSVFRFDRVTGIISDPVQISIGINYGVEFSPDGRYLYSTSYLSSSIYQYDVSLADAAVAASRIEVGTTMNTTNGTLQLGPNGKIYLAEEGELFIGEIAQPNVRGVGCQFRDKAISLGGKRSGLGLPNMFPAVFLQETVYSIMAKDGCEGDTSRFSVEPRDSVSQLQWDFGDPSSGTANRAIGNDVSHIYLTAGPYTIKVTYRTATGPSVERVITITIGTRPQISAGPDQTTCAGQTVQLKALGAATFHWSPGNLVQDSTAWNTRTTVTRTTTFILTGKGPEGCKSYDTITVFVTSGSVTASPDTAFCIGGVAQLRAIGASSYVWSPSAGLTDTTSASPLASLTSTTRYRVIGTRTTCIDTAYVTVTVNKLPVVTTSGDVTVCAGTESVLTASGAVRYVWTPQAGIADPTSPSIIVSPITTTPYVVRGWSAEGCLDSASVTVTIGGNISVNHTADTAVCEGSSATLRCFTPGTTTWTDRSDGSTQTGAAITVSPVSSTWYVIDVLAGGCTGRDSVYVTVVKAPTASIIPDTTICEGDSVLLSVGTTGNVIWFPTTGLSNSTASTVVAYPFQTTTYTATINNQGCVAVSTVTITVRLPDKIALTSSNISGPIGSSIPTPITSTIIVATLVPLNIQVTYPVSSLDVVAVASPFVREISRTVVGSITSIAFEVTAVPNLPEIFSINIVPLLSRSSTLVIDYSVSSENCAIPDTASIIVETTKCGGDARSVALGAAAAMSVSVVPLPIMQGATVGWSSPSIGSHTVQIYASDGTLVYRQKWHRDVSSSTTGTITVAEGVMSAGVYAVVFQTEDGVVTTPCVKVK